jgi:hypothetical protein
MPTGGPPQLPQPGFNGTQIPPQVAQGALAMLRGGAGTTPPSPFAQAAGPINLLNMGGTPPTAARIPLPKTTNTRGHNRGGKVNTNTAIHAQNSNPESVLANKASSLQR